LHIAGQVHLISRPAPFCLGPPSDRCFWYFAPAFGSATTRRD